jgi:hypothetical protein
MTLMEVHFETEGEEPQEALSLVPPVDSPGQRILNCPNCGNATLEEDAWGERDPVTGLLYAEPRVLCTTCQWVQPR